MKNPEQLSTAELSITLRGENSQTEWAKRIGYADQGAVSHLETGKIKNNQVRAHLLDIAKWEG